MKQSATDGGTNASEDKGNLISTTADKMKSQNLKAPIKEPSSPLN